MYTWLNIQRTTYGCSSFLFLGGTRPCTCQGHPHHRLAFTAGPLVGWCNGHHITHIKSGGCPLHPAFPLWHSSAPQTDLPIIAVPGFGGRTQEVATFASCCEWIMEGPRYKSMAASQKQLHQSRESWHLGKAYHHTEHKGHPCPYFSPCDWSFFNAVT